MESLEENFKKNQSYLKLGDKESWEGTYIGWERIQTKFGKPGYRFSLERMDGTRLTWDTGNTKAINQMFPMKKGDQIRIYREGIDKTDTRYTVDKMISGEKLPF